MKHITKYTLTSFLLLLGIYKTTFAQDYKLEQNDENSIQSTLQKVSFSGFGDFLAIIEKDDSHQLFEIGQAEIELGYPLSENTNLTLAIAYNNDAFEIGSFYYEHLFQKENSPNSITFTIGQFDVPYGIDWNVYPSFDRNLITSPFIVSETHDCWNDLGINMTYENRFISSSIYAINGFSHECLDRNNDQIITENNYAVGSRVGLKINHNFTIGGSVAYVDDKNHINDMYLYGSDFSWNLKNLSVKAEYIQHNVTTVGTKDFHDDGYYVQSKYDFSNFYIVNRISSHRHIDEDYAYRYSNGIGISIQKNVIARAEWYHNTENNSNKLFLQLAFGY